MSRKLNLALAFVLVLLASVGSVSAIQLQNGTVGSSAGQGQPGVAAQPEMQVEQKSGAALPRAGSEIWIPGLGVVGRMPSLDFGLDMLYGQSDGSSDVPDRSDFDNIDPEFAIKGTIRKKF